MNAVERAAGLWLHRLLVRLPRAHAELLNQYRSSEDFAKRFPRTVCAELLADGPLKAKYRKHQADEQRHERAYAARIRKLGGEPQAVDVARDYLLQTWREASAAGVGVPYARFHDPRPLDRTERMRLWAFQTVVEERGLIEMAAHAAACTRDQATLDLLESITPDERHHAEYSRRALDDAAEEVPAQGAQEARALIETMRQAEDRAYRRVTLALLGALRAGPLTEASWLERRIVWLFEVVTRASVRETRGALEPASAAW